MSTIPRWPPASMLPGLRDFWRVYDAHYDALQREATARLMGHPILGPMLRALPAEVLESQSASSRQRLAEAMESGDFTAAWAAQRGQGALYATMGLPFSSWYDLSKVLYELIVPLLVAEFASDRLTAALVAMSSFLDTSLAMVGDEYLETKRNLRLAAEAQHRATIDASLDPIVSMDTQGLITEFNPAAERTFGFLRAEAVGKPFEELLVPPRLRADHRHGLSRYLMADGSVMLGTRRETAAVRRDGSEFPVEIGVVEVRQADGQLAFTHFMRDISERRRAEQLNAESQRAQQASRLKSEFLANMSHELRTPLNSIIGFAELLHEGEVGALAPQQTEFVGDILSSGRHLLQLINDILDLSKIEAGKMEFRPEPTDVGRVVHEVTSLLRTSANAKKITVEQELDPLVPAVLLDPARLKQILYNYLSNALKFTPSGGRVVVRSRATPSAFELAVSDNGIGISEADQARLFTEFEQLDGGAAKLHGGTGLGLALTKRIIEAQGGSVGVRSEVGKGSTFWVSLPLHAALPGSAIDPDGPYARAGAPTVLVVEDDTADQRIIAEALFRAGYGVRLAATGAQALALAAAVRFDAVTLDLILPDMSGLEVLRGLRQQPSTEHIPVVLVTVVTESATGGSLVHDTLPKPLNEAALLASLERARVVPATTGPVWVIDDDQGALKLMAQLLGQLGYRATCHDSAAAALGALDDTPPRAVILDLMMPGLDGLEFLARFRGLPAHAHTPVLIWTTHDLATDALRALRSRVQGIVPKGIGSASLAETLQGFLRPALAQRGGP